MYYKNGELVKNGDSVLIEHGKTAGTVHSIIDSSNDMNEWGVAEKGLMISAPEFGLVFWPELDEDAVVFVARQKT